MHYTWARLKNVPRESRIKVYSLPSFEKWKVDQKWLLQRRAWRLFFVDTKYYCTFKAGPALRVNFLLATIMPARLHLALVLFCSCISTINATLRNDWILLLLNDFSHVFSDADKKLSLLPKFAFVALTFFNLPNCKSKKAECNTSFFGFRTPPFPSHHYCRDQSHCCFTVLTSISWVHALSTHKNL